MNNTPYGNWGDGTTLAAALLQGVQGEPQGVNLQPLQNPDRSLVNQFEPR